MELKYVQLTTLMNIIEKETTIRFGMKEIPTMLLNSKRFPIAVKLNDKVISMDVFNTKEKDEN